MTGSEVTGPVNLGNPCEIPIRQIAELIIEMVGSRVRLVHHDLPADDPARLNASATRARKLGEILVSTGKLTAESLEWAVAHQPKHVRLGEFLVRSHLLTEDQLYQALSLQASIPLSRFDPQRIGRNVARSLPAHVIERHRLIPVQIAGGFLFVASPELPDPAKERELARYTRLTVRMQLLTATNFETLRRALL